MLVHYFQMINNFLFVCQSVSWLTLLLKSDKYRDISSSRWDMFLKLFGDIPQMLVHLLQINVDFLYIWDKCRDISCSEWDIFLSFFDISGIFTYYFQIISMPCIDHVETIFGIALLWDGQELWNCQDWVNRVERIPL